MELKMEVAPLGMARFASLPFELLEDLASKSGDGRDALLIALFGDPMINEAIYVASRSLHDRLTTRSGSIPEQRDHLDALAKYIQRMAFRATPFGLFASAGIARIGHELRAVAPNPSDLKRRCRLDWSAVFQLTKRAAASSAATVTMNDTLGTFGDRIRYVSLESQATAIGQRHFTLEEAELDEALGLVATCLNQPMSRLSLAQALDAGSNGRYPIEAWHAYIDDLIEAQILCFDHLTPLTADNPLDCLAEQALPPDVAQIRAALDAAEAVPMPRSALDHHHAVDVLAAGLKVGQTSRSNVQVDLFDTRDTGLTLSVDEAAEVEKAVNIVLQPTTSLLTVLSEFIGRFTERFGSTRVPILTALDGANGVGYGATIAPGNDLLRAFGAFAERTTAATAVRMVKETTDFPLGRPAGDLYSRLTPDSLSPPPWPDYLQPRMGTANCNLWRDDDGRAMVEVRGVSTRDSGRMYGRFAHALPVLREALSAPDESSDSEEIVAEIVHLPVDRMANVATRPALSRYEIPIRTGASPGAIALPLSELSLFVRNNRLHLYSETLKKVVRPRVSNAHLPKGPMQLGVYRLLMDMVAQEVTGIQFSLRSAFPAARFLPGLIVGGVIVGRPTWRMPDQLRPKSLSASHMVAARQAFRCWAKEMRLPAWFTAIQGDNVLPIHLASDWMLTEMLKLFASKDRMDISDLSPLGMKPFVRGADGHTHHHHEVVVTLSNPIYKPRRAYPPMKYDPGLVDASQERWDYTRLYASHHQQRTVLLELSKELHGEEFFFIRYIDHGGPHLRVRLKRKARGLRLADVSEALRLRGHIHSYATDIYVPETERYGGPAALPHIEDLFCADTRYVLRILRDTSTDTRSLWMMAVHNMHSYLSSLGLSQRAEQLAFADRACADFEREFGFSKDDRATVGKIFRGFPRSLDDLCLVAMRDNDIASFHESIAAHWKTATTIDGLTGQALYGIRWSIIHMHANRLFPAQQRSHEAVCWQLLRRVLLRETKRETPET